MLLALPLAGLAACSEDDPEVSVDRNALAEMVGEKGLAEDAPALQFDKLRAFGVEEVQYISDDQVDDFEEIVAELGLNSCDETARSTLELMIDSLGLGPALVREANADVDAYVSANCS